MIRLNVRQAKFVTGYEWALRLQSLLLVVLFSVCGLAAAFPLPEVSSDVDRYISGLQASRPNPQRWAVIIGIEKYQQTFAALFARRDAQSFKEYARKLLEIPEENIFPLLDEEATKTRLQVLLEERLPRRLKPGDQVFVYYAGHGLADPRTGQLYLLPSDADPQSIQLSGYSAEAFYGALGRLKEQRVVVFLDACFSGIAGRQQQAQPLLPGARSLVWKIENPALKHSNITVLAAAQHDQVSNGDPENGHGLFTYHLLRGLVGEGDLNGDGRVRLGELASYVKDAVDRKSRLLYGQTRDQIPDLTPAKLDTGQDIELTSWTGQMPPAEKRTITTKPESRPTTSLALIKYQEFPKFRIEVEGLQTGLRGDVSVFLSYENKTQEEIKFMLIGAVLNRTFLLDNAGNRYKYESSSGLSGDMSDSYMNGEPMSLAPGTKGTVSFTFSSPLIGGTRGNLYTLSSEQSLVKPGVDPYLTWKKVRIENQFNITIRNIEPR